MRHASGQAFPGPQDRHVLGVRDQHVHGGRPPLRSQAQHAGGFVDLPEASDGPVLGCADGLQHAGQGAVHRVHAGQGARHLVFQPQQHAFALACIGLDLQQTDLLLHLGIQVAVLVEATDLRGLHGQGALVVLVEAVAVQLVEQKDPAVAAAQRDHWCPQGTGHTGEMPVHQAAQRGAAACGIEAAGAAVLADLRQFRLQPPDGVGLSIRTATRDDAHLRRFRVVQHGQHHQPRAEQGAHAVAEVLEQCGPIALGGQAHTQVDQGREPAVGLFELLRLLHQLVRHQPQVVAFETGRSGCHRRRRAVVRQRRLHGGEDPLGLAGLESTCRTPQAAASTRASSSRKVAV